MTDAKKPAAAAKTDSTDKPALKEQLPEDAVPRLVAPLNRTAVSEQKFQNLVHQAVVRTSVTIEDILAPGFWAHVTDKVNLWDHIWVIPEDGSWKALLHVHQKGASYLVVKLLQHWDLSDAGDDVAPEVKGLKLVWRGPIEKWSVIDEATGNVLKAGIVRKLDAVRERDELIETLLR